MLTVIRSLAVLILSSLLLFFASTIYANHIPPPTGYVNDFAGVLTSDQKTILEAFLKDYEQKSTNEIVVATVKSLNGDSIENFAVRTFEEWKIGKRDENNGILFLAATEDRKMRLEIGYGLEPYLTDSQAGEIIRNTITPQFRLNNYYTGIKLGITAMEEQISSEVESATRYSFFSDAIYGGLSLLVFILMLLNIVLFIVLSVILSRDHKYSEGTRKTIRTGWGICIILFFVSWIGFSMVKNVKSYHDFVIVIFASMGLFVWVYFPAFLARSKQFWAGGVAGIILGVILGLVLRGDLFTIIKFSLICGAIGLALDFILSKNYERLKKIGRPTGFWGSLGGFHTGGGFGGGSSGGGGASGSW